MKIGCKNLPPYFFHGAFAPSFIWCRRPCFVLYAVVAELTFPTHSLHFSAYYNSITNYADTLSTRVFVEILSIIRWFLLLFSRRISLTRSNLSIFTRNVTGFYFRFISKVLTMVKTVGIIIIIFCKRLFVRRRKLVEAKCDST